MKPKLEKIKTAREFRKNPTKSELMFWEQVKAKRFNGIKFRRQVVLSGFIVDFCCHEYKLIIEIDGDIHKEQREYDKEREEIIKESGYGFFRVTADEVESNIDSVLNKLNMYIKELVPLSATLGAERG